MKTETFKVLGMGDGIHCIATLNTEQEAHSYVQEIINWNKIYLPLVDYGYYVESMDKFFDDFEIVCAT